MTNPQPEDARMLRLGGVSEGEASSETAASHLSARMAKAQEVLVGLPHARNCAIVSGYAACTCDRPARAMFAFSTAERASETAAPDGWRDEVKTWERDNPFPRAPYGCEHMSKYLSPQADWYAAKAAFVRSMAASPASPQASPTAASGGRKAWDLVPA